MTVYMKAYRARLSNLRPLIHYYPPVRKALEDWRPGFCRFCHLRCQGEVCNFCRREIER